MFERFAGAARTAVEDARYEAGRRGDRQIGTEHLLLALLHDEALARVVGVDAQTAQQAADRLDREALAAIGVALGEFRPTADARLGSASRMTPGAKTVIQRALGNATAEKARAITSRHLFLALLDRREPDPAVAVLKALDVDERMIRARLAAA